MAERTVFQSISQRHVVSLGPQASVGSCLRDDARQLRQRAHPRHAGRPLGILTERDLMTRVLARA